MSSTTAPVTAIVVVAPRGAPAIAPIVVSVIVVVASAVISVVTPARSIVTKNTLSQEPSYNSLCRSNKCTQYARGFILLFYCF